MTEEELIARNGGSHTRNPITGTLTWSTINAPGPSIEISPGRNYKVVEIPAQEIGEAGSAPFAQVVEQITLEQAVIILNKHKHNFFAVEDSEMLGWSVIDTDSAEKYAALCRYIIEYQHTMGAIRNVQSLTKFEAIAIAKEYLRS